MDTAILYNHLKQIKYPGFSRDIVSFGLVQKLDYDPEKKHVSITLTITTADGNIATLLEENIRHILTPLADINTLELDIQLTPPKHNHSAANTQGDKKTATEKPAALSQVRHIIAIASGKGGVGKSTVAVNLACALEQALSKTGKPNAVGLLDCDIYGPSVPLMMGLNQSPHVEGQYIVPICNFGVSVMSMGLLVDEDAPVIWRGPMVNKTIQQFSEQVAWGELEVLVVDLPPGTGDAQLSLVQTIPLDGAIIVTTPQKAAFEVARRGARMFDKVGVSLLGVVENMSYWLNTSTGKVERLFGEGGGAYTAAALDTELLAQIPISEALRQGGDCGVPIIVNDERADASKVFTGLARRILEKLDSKRFSTSAFVVN